MKNIEDILLLISKNFAHVNGTSRHSNITFSGNMTNLPLPGAHHMNTNTLGWVSSYGT